MQSNIVNLVTPDSNIHHETMQSIKNTLNQQSQALTQLAENISIKEYTQALALMNDCLGHIIICGMGKSGHVGRKIAATLASTGTPAFFLHPGEAFHGDLGMITHNDVVMLISNSGESDEILKLIPSLKIFGNKIIAITGKQGSTLAKHAQATLLIDSTREACPNNLAPTTSTTLTMAIGDALAVALMEQKQFKPQDFAKYHPGGSLGRRLLTKVSDVMITHDLPLVSPTDSMSNVIMQMTQSHLGLAIIHNNRKLIGVITDGDLRRALVNGMELQQSMAQDMIASSPITTPVTISENAQLQQGEDLMRESHIKHLVVLNDSQHITGVLEFFQ
ncbi:KpsF/GutQ family sugar-phosphate isomerase [uncultured Shewanella sp.]|uniref:KpsF/GutQ family sugar-phosphate isomerase n=1 Tax=uncultured Shewanella sp. TaxID=173975 RepID=UPI00260F03A0|nr:KpsF/GutQ family sugar-phosphate isomerase [uncultured Shewanella sp.]